MIAFARACRRDEGRGVWPVVEQSGRNPDTEPIDTRGDLEQLRVVEPDGLDDCGATVTRVEWLQG